MKVSWERKVKEKQKQDAIKAEERLFKERIKQEQEEKKKIREQRKRLREENELKSSTFQVITNTQKIKKMNKKQLKKIRKI